jgi:hypothetical protein
MQSENRRGVDMVGVMLKRSGRRFRFWARQTRLVRASTVSERYGGECVIYEFE